MYGCMCFCSPPVRSGSGLFVVVQHGCAMCVLFTTFVTSYTCRINV